MKPLFPRLVRLGIYAVFALIFIGGLVRVAGAGMGCPDWPKCFGSWIPPLNVSQLPPDIDATSFNFTLAWIEYFNRLIGVSVGLLLAAVAVIALARYRRRLGILVPSIGAALLTGFQGWLGSAVVASELKPLVVSIHMLLALVIVSLLLYVYRRLDAPSKDAERRSFPDRLRRWALLIWAGGIIQILLGTEVRSAFENAAREMPLLSPLELIGHVGAINTVHMIIGLVLALITVIAGSSIIRLGGGTGSLAGRFSLGLIGLVVVQAVLGLMLTIYGLQPLLQLFHLWTGAIYVGIAMSLYVLLRSGEKSGRERMRPLVLSLARIAAAVLVLSVGALAVVHRAESSRLDIPFIKQVPEFTFVEMSGSPFGLDDLKGKISIVDFFFTSCHGPCPVMASRMSELYKEYAHSDKVQLVSFTVDPETDTPEVLQAYAKAHGVTDNRWRFVRGTQEEISQLCEDGFLVSGDLPGMHSIMFILVDQDGWIRGFYDHDDPSAMAQLRRHVAELARQL